MPFSSLNDFQIIQEFESVKKYFQSLMRENNYDNIIAEHKFLNKLNGTDVKHCKYYDVDEFLSI